MKNDTDLPQSVTILEHVQKPTKQRFFVLPSCNQWFLQKRCRLQRGL